MILDAFLNDYDIRSCHY